MSIECGECEHLLGSGHDPCCSRGRPIPPTRAECLRVADELDWMLGACLVATPYREIIRARVTRLRRAAEHAARLFCNATKDELHMTGHRDGCQVAEASRG